MKKQLLLVTSIFIYSFSFCQQNNYWQQKVNYKIDVTLDDTLKTLDGYVSMQYYNNSPDTLRFIWFHVWPNAYKNDRTALVDQFLENGSTDLYFSNEEKRGYINRLDFKVDKITATTQDHQQHQDIIKLLLPIPLAPGAMATIETPFHVKLPYNFSRSGYIGKSFQITQWYPKPAVYDRKGWHEMPYLDQGEFYSEFGNYEVQISVPKNYVVAATGELQNEEEQQWMLERTDEKWGNEFRQSHSGKKKSLRDGRSISKDTISGYFPPSETTFKTLQFKQDNIHDFAWFADKRFVVEKDTLRSASGKIIHCYSYYLPQHHLVWKNSTLFIKKTVAFRSSLLGEYPYQYVSAVDVDSRSSGGMEYPTITSISGANTTSDLEDVIEHEVGHNWFYGILASNERLHPWMDEGMNTYYDGRYMLQYKVDTGKSTFINKRIPDNSTDQLDLILSSLVKVNKDQPIESTSEIFPAINYAAIVYYKTALWMRSLETTLGTSLFDSVMHVYYERWKFKHPYPEDFKNIVEEISKQNVDANFFLLNKKGAIQKPVKKDLRLTSFFSFKETNKHNYIFLSPAIGYNYYDKFMIGGLIHNYTLPETRFRFIVVPLYGTGSKEINGIGRLSYSSFGSKGSKFEIALAGEKFSADEFTDSTNTKNYQSFNKIVPSLKYVFANKNPRSHVHKYIQWKTFLINETGISFLRDTINQVDIISYPKESRYINQLKFVIENNRKLYPYNASLQAEQGKSFIRFAFTGDYFFNYPKGGGLNFRLFAGKFIYTKEKTFITQYETDRYHLNLSGPKGYEDYTYSNYFVGRNEFDGFSNRQVMNRDGAFKVKTDLLSDKIGKTDDWLSAINLNTTIPKQINPLSLLPVKIPVKIFVDIGTYAEAWKTDAATGRFLYDAGFQVSLFADVLNIYFPVLYSKVYRDYFKSTITEKIFSKNISFSIDIQNISVKRLIPQISF